MHPYFKPVVILMAAMILTALLVGLIGAYSAGFLFLVALLSIPLAFILLVLAIIVSIAATRGAFREHAGARPRIEAAIAPPLMIAVAFVAMLPAIWLGIFLGDASRLFINRAAYDRIVQRVQRDRSEAWFAEDSSGIVYSVDLGPPIRVAFNPEGILDNWSAIVFDPTGEMVQAEGFDPNTGKFVAPDRITKLFGGDLVKCRPMWGDYYSCSFT